MPRALRVCGRKLLTLRSGARRECSFTSGSPQPGTRRVWFSTYLNLTSRNSESHEDRQELGQPRRVEQCPLSHPVLSVPRSSPECHGWPEASSERSLVVVSLAGKRKKIWAVAAASM